jgi:hypothetical protein
MSDVPQQRRTHRVSLVIPIEVMGTDIRGQPFSEKAQTAVISRYGAAIVLKREVAPEQQVLIRRIDNGQEAVFRVLGQIGRQAEGSVYGVALMDSSVNLWGIHFPPLAESAQAVGRVLLECAACQSREIAYLSELDAEVFEANHCLSRPCKGCNQTTFWRQAEHTITSKRTLEPFPGRAVPGPSPTSPRRTQNERAYARVKTKFTACIRHATLGDEVIVTEDVSRGGLRFKSHKHYSQGSLIEVAFPYSPTGANIFASARIIRAQEHRGEGLVEYGVAFVRVYGPMGER